MPAEDRSHQNRAEDERRIEEQLADTPSHELDDTHPRVVGLVGGAMVHVRATVSDAWKALTDPSLVVQWFYGAKLRTTWKVDDPIVFSGEWEGRAFEHQGTVLSHDPPHGLAYTHVDPVTQRTSTVMYKVEEEALGARITVAQDRCPNVDHRDRCSTHWQAALQSLKKVVEAV